MSKNNTIDLCTITLDGSDYTLYGVDSSNCQYNATEFYPLNEKWYYNHDATFEHTTIDNSVCDISSKVNSTSTDTTSSDPGDTI